MQGGGGQFVTIWKLDCGKMLKYIPDWEDCDDLRLSIRKSVNQTKHNNVNYTIAVKVTNQQLSLF